MIEQVTPWFSPKFLLVHIHVCICNLMKCTSIHFKHLVNVHRAVQRQMHWHNCCSSNVAQKVHIILPHSVHNNNKRQGQCMRCCNITTCHNMAFNEGVIFIGHTVLNSLTVADIIVFEPNTHTLGYLSSLRCFRY